MSFTKRLESLVPVFQSLFTPEEVRALQDQLQKKKYLTEKKQG